MTADKKVTACCVVLAAGLGTRMRSSIPKVLHTVFDRPMLHYILDAVRPIGFNETVVVAGAHSAEMMAESIRSGYPSVRITLQDEQNGTAHALMAGLSAIKKFKGTVMVLNGDTPLVGSPTLKAFLGRHRKARNAVSVATFTSSDPSAYGRLIREPGGRIRIVEAADATERELAVREVNSGLYAIEPDALALLKSIKPNPKKKELYLTDIIELAQRKGLKAGAFLAPDEYEFLGINTRIDLVEATKAMQWRTNARLLDSGVTLLDPASTFISPEAKIGPDTVIYPNVHIEGATRIGQRCTIMPNVRIHESTIADGVTIKDGSVIEEASVGAGTQVGPYAHLRPGAVLKRDVRVGNFVEVKKSVIGDGTKAMHLSYLGDASIGKGVNIGAGTITCNYDGAHKHRTEIGDGVFIGSDTQLVAPVKVGRGAYVGAGTTVTSDVPAEALVISRIRQRIVPGWAASKKKA